jgi:hypothetical protein
MEYHRATPVTQITLPSLSALLLLPISPICIFSTILVSVFMSSKWPLSDFRVKFLITLYSIYRPPTLVTFCVNFKLFFLGEYTVKEPVDMATTLRTCICDVPCLRFSG